jgi:hypothetical protein
MAAYLRPFHPVLQDFLHYCPFSRAFSRRRCRAVAVPTRPFTSTNCSLTSRRLLKPLQLSSLLQDEVRLCRKRLFRSTPLIFPLCMRPTLALLRSTLRSYSSASAPTRSAMPSVQLPQILLCDPITLATSVQEELSSKYEFVVRPFQPSRSSPSKQRSPFAVSRLVPISTFPSTTPRRRSHRTPSCARPRHPTHLLFPLTIAAVELVEGGIP